MKHIRIVISDNPFNPVWKGGIKPKDKKRIIRVSVDPDFFNKR